MFLWKVFILAKKVNCQRAFQKSVLSSHPSSPATVPSQWTPNNPTRGKGWSPHCVGGRRDTDWEPWVHAPLSLCPRTKWVSQHRCGCTSCGIRARPKQSGGADMVGTFTWAACAGKWALVVAPRKSKPIPVGSGETTRCLKKALSCISVFLVFVKGTCSRPHEPWEISMFSFPPWQYSWAIWLSSFFSPRPSLPVPISASICVDVGQPYLWLQDKTICSKMCATLLLRSPGLQFRAPLDVTELMLSGPFLFPVSHSRVSFCWIEDGSLGLDHGGYCHPFESYLTYLRMASLCLFQTNEEDTWTVMLENVCFFYDTLCKQIWFFKMKCEWVTSCQGI